MPRSTGLGMCAGRSVPVFGRPAMNQLSKPLSPEPSPSEVIALFEDMAEVFADASARAEKLATDELVARLTSNGHSGPAIQWAIYRVEARQWLTRQFEQRRVRSENPTAGTTTAKPILLDTQVLVPTQ